MNTDELRALVREVLHEVLSEQSHAVPDASHAVPDASHAVPGMSHAVSDASHAVPGMSHAVPGVTHAVPDLSHAVPDVSRTVPGISHAVPGGSHAVPEKTKQEAGPRGERVPAVHRIEKGAVTERHVDAAVKDDARLVLGRRAVLTPLAKDRIRATGITVEREG